MVKMVISLNWLFNSFGNQHFVKEDKDVFKISFSFSSFSEISETLETHERKKYIFQHQREIKTSRNQGT